MSRRGWVALAVVAQAVIVPNAVAPQLSARLLGTEYRLRVEPLDPIDPFRGAYVSLAYPDLDREDVPAAEEVFVPLVVGGDGIARGGAVATTRPDRPPYLTCVGEGWLRCGIDSLFLPQGEAAAVGEAIRAGTAVATVRVDRRGHAALISVDVPG